MKQIVLIIFCLISLLGYSQTNYDYTLQAESDSVVTTKNTPAGTTSINADKRFFKLLDTYNAIDKKEKAIEGYRIQIITSNNKANVLKIKSEFYSRYNDVKTYVHYKQPNFKLRVGNFRNKLDAQKMLLQIVRHYHDAFIVKETIPLKELHPEE